jgi:SAM-dependent MidA family methyltransferase
VSEQARDAVRRAILDRGPISFAEFMEIALYGPGGYYEGHPVGERGDFVTSPHVHPVFATFVAEALAQMWELLGSPDPFRLIEVGAGDGTLAQLLRQELWKVADGLRLEYTAVERSPGAREALRRVERLRVLPAIEAAPIGIVGCVFANELLDNLPFHWLRDTDHGTVEVGVDRAPSEDGFVFIERPWPMGGMDPIDADSPGLRAGEERAVPLAGYRLVERVARILSSGYALFVDYVGPVERGALVHGYRGHRVLGADDLLVDPGSSDITAAVDLAAIVSRAQAVGLQAFMPVSQRAVLLALGFDEWAAAERRRQASMQDARSGREAVETWSGRNAAGLLVDPQGLGGLKWLLLGSSGLPAPTWLATAVKLDAEGD